MDNIDRELLYYSMKAEYEYYEELANELFAKYKEKVAQNAPEEEIQAVIGELRSTCGVYIDVEE